MLAKSFGLYIYKKEKKDHNVLKDLLQFVRSQHNQTTVSFAYIEAQNSLIPSLSLWENLQLASGGDSWQEIAHTLDAQWRPLINLIQHHDKLAAKAEPWERFLVSLLKGILSPGKILFIDFDEDLFSPLIVQNLKKTLIQMNQKKTIYLACTSSSLWLDCAHSIISREGFEFHVESLDQDSIKRHWAA